MQKLRNTFLQQLAINNSISVSKYFTLAFDEAIKLSSIFSNMKEVKKAYKIALSGDINVDFDPEVQRAREFLRESLSSIVLNYNNVVGEKLKIHFHLPNGRSFLRIYRQKNAIVDNKQLDLSDNLLTTRETIRTIINTHKKITGIEIGSSGFVLRGIVPIFEENKYIGSVEALVDFDDILPLIKNDQNSFLNVYMVDEFLSIAQKFKDENKYPRNGRFVEIYTTDEEKFNHIITVDFLEKGKRKLSIKVVEGYCFSAFPIFDFKDRVVGVMVYGFSVDHYIKLINSLRTSLLITIITMMGIFLIISIVATNKIIINPIKRLAEQAQKIRDGNLEVNMYTDNKDEIGDLSLCLSDMVDRLKLKIKEVELKNQEAEKAKVKIQQALEETKMANERAFIANKKGKQMAADIIEKVNKEIEENASKLKKNIDKTIENVNLQKEMLHEIATAMEQINTTILEIAQNSASTAELAENTRNHAQEGLYLSSEVISFMDKVKEESHSMQNGVNKLGNRAKEISKVLNVIEDIADQTNLLALNAAIEAARAGDAGRGFAVVADEVRRLAEKTIVATKEIADVIKNIQDDTVQNIEKVDRVVGILNKGEDLIKKTGKFLEKIASLAKDTSQKINSIAAATEEQSAATEQVNKKTLETNIIAEKTQEIMKMANDDLKDLYNSILSLKDVINDLRNN